jgi:hypothetical protein
LPLFLLPRSLPLFLLPCTLPLSSPSHLARCPSLFSLAPCVSLRYSPNLSLALLSQEGPLAGESR